MNQPVGVILAAGRADRMGRPKQLLPYGNTTVLGQVVDTAVESRLSRVVVVVGNYYDEVVGRLERDDVELLTNPDPDQGNLSSLLVASRVVAPSPILLLMGDMPGVTTAIINRHLEEFAEAPAWLRVTEYTDRRGHPLLLSSELVAELDQLRGPKVLWRLTGDERTRSLVIEDRMPVDVDTPDDYQTALERQLRGG